MHPVLLDQRFRNQVPLGRQTLLAVRCDRYLCSISSVEPRPKREQICCLTMLSDACAQHRRATHLRLAIETFVSGPHAHVGDVVEYLLLGVQNAIRVLPVVLRDIVIARWRRDAWRHASEAHIALKQVDELQVRALHLGDDLLNRERL
eukprot:scaffold96304_cov32-Tisochrysis_lutea.AAC.3